MEWQTGLDSRKEFYSDILLDNPPFDRSVEKIFTIKNAYDKIIKQVNKKGASKLKIIQFIPPLMWSHAEYAVLLIKKNLLLSRKKQR